MCLQHMFWYARCRQHMFNIRLYDKISSAHILFIWCWQPCPVARRCVLAHVKSDLATEAGATSTCLKSACVTKSGQARYCSQRAGIPGPVARCSMLVHVKSDMASEPGAASTCLISQRDKIWSSQKVSTQSWQLWPRGQVLHASTC